MDQLDIEKLQNVPIDLRNVTSNVDKLHADRLLLVPVDLSKLSDAVKADVVKKYSYNAKIKQLKTKCLILLT